MLVIQRPTVEAIDEEEGNLQRFAISPLEPGFGHTLGNSLRRTLLSSIPGAAITSVRFDDALHEFDTIAGVTEDVTDIILNLKDIVVTSSSDEPVTLRLDVRGPAEVTGRRHPGHLRRRDPQPGPARRHRRRQRPPGARPHHRARQGLRPEHRSLDHDHRCDPGRRDLLAGAPCDLHRRADPCRAVDQLRPARPRDRDRRLQDPREALASAGETLHPARPARRPASRTSPRA